MVVRPILFLFLCVAWFLEFGQKDEYLWTKVTEEAAFPKSYNFHVFVVGDEMWMINGGGWKSTDGKKWTKTTLQNTGLNSAYQDYVLFKGAVLSLGSMHGDYQDLELSSRVARTRDLQDWETVAGYSELPRVVFYGSAVFKDKIWIVGGWDGSKYHNDIWNSTDGISWKNLGPAPWSPRTVSGLVVFRNRLWFHGGGVIDGEASAHPDSVFETWTSEDGLKWERVRTKYDRVLSGTPIVFDGKLWLVGGNRSKGNFGNAVFVTSDGVNWERRSAPWSPRGGVAVWVFQDKLYMTGGKYSETVNGEVRFIYSNDVWAMTRSR